MKLGSPTESQEKARGGYWRVIRGSRRRLRILARMASEGASVSACDLGVKRVAAGLLLAGDALAACLNSDVLVVLADYVAAGFVVQSVGRV